MDANRAAAAAEDLAELSPDAAAALDAFRRAARADDTARQLVRAFDAVQAGHQGEQLSRAGLAAILMALDQAHDVAAVVLDAGIAREKIRQCCEAAAGLVAFWSMTEAERAALDPLSHADSLALMRLLRNAIESFTLLDMLLAHAALRRQDTIDRLKAEALTGSATGDGHVLA